MTRLDPAVGRQFDGKEVDVNLINNLHHLTFVTADMDRLIAFYEDVFDASAVIDMEEDGLRHAFIELGAETVLHPFEIPGVEPPEGQPMFQRGRLDHFALNATSEEAFREIRRRLMAAGATDGRVIDMGALWLLTFSDPDKGEHEVVWVVPDMGYDEVRVREEWTTVEM